MKFYPFVLSAFAAGASAFAPTKVGRFDTSCNALSVPGMWTSGLNFGKGDFRFYKSFDSFMKPFTPEDKEAFPEVFNIPKVRFVSLMKFLETNFELTEYILSRDYMRSP